MQLRFSWCLVFVPQMQCFYLPVAVKNSCLPAESASPEFPVFLLFSGFAQLCAPSLFTFKIWFKRGVVGRGEGLSWESACCSGSQHPHTNWLGSPAPALGGRRRRDPPPSYPFLGVGGLKVPAFHCLTFPIPSEPVCGSQDPGSCGSDAVRQKSHCHCHAGNPEGLGALF